MPTHHGKIFFHSFQLWATCYFPAAVLHSAVYNIMQYWTTLYRESKMSIPLSGFLSGSLPSICSLLTIHKFRYQRPSNWHQIDIHLHKNVGSMPNWGWFKALSATKEMIPGVDRSIMSASISWRNFYHSHICDLWSSTSNIHAIQSVYNDNGLVSYITSNYVNQWSLVVLTDTSGTNFSSV